MLGIFTPTVPVESPQLYIRRKHRVCLPVLGSTSIILLLPQLYTNQVLLPISQADKYPHVQQNLPCASCSLNASDARTAYKNTVALDSLDHHYSLYLLRIACKSPLIRAVLSSNQTPPALYNNDATSWGIQKRNKEREGRKSKTPLISPVSNLASPDLPNLA